LHGLGLGHWGLLLGKSRGAEHRARELEQSLPRRPLVADAAEEREQLSGAEAVLGGAGSPVLAKLAEVDVLLPLARLHRCELRGIEAALSLLRDLLDHLGAAGRGLPAPCARDARHSCPPPPRVSP